MEYAKFLDRVLTVFKKENFELEQQVSIYGYIVDLFSMSIVLEDLDLWPWVEPRPYHKRSWRDGNERQFSLLGGNAPYRYIFAITSASSVSSIMMKDFSNNVYTYSCDRASKLKDLHRFVIPVIASKSCPSEAISFVRTYEGLRWDWPICHVIHPVIFDLESVTAYHDENVTFKGYRPKRHAKEAVEEYLLGKSLRKVEHYEDHFYNCTKCGKQYVKDYEKCPYCGMASPRSSTI